MFYKNNLVIPYKNVNVHFSENNEQLFVLHTPNKTWKIIIHYSMRKSFDIYLWQFSLITSSNDFEFFFFILPIKVEEH